MRTPSAMSIAGHRMGLLRCLIAMLAMLFVAVPATAQFSDSYNFLKAVREGDGAKATQMLNSSASTLINTRDFKTGEGALHILVKKRDLGWIAFILSKDANPNVRDDQGNSPLITAAQLGFVEGAKTLISVRANVNQANNSGETPLIIAVQHRDIPMVRLLLTSGANPALTDRIAGKSARDYAVDDARAAAILKILDETKPVKAAKPMSGPMPR